jgi:Kef-type K+ transport system membrane component KefB
METFPHWIIILIVVISLSKIAVLFTRRLAISAVTIQLLIGIILGPTLLNILGVPMVLGTWGSPSSGSLHGVLKIFAEIGLIQLMFLAGLEVDWRELKKTLTLSFSMGAWGFVLTAVSVAIIAWIFVGRWSEALAMSAVMSVSSFGVSSYYFSEMKVLGSRVAVMVSGAAFLSGILAILWMIASQATYYAMIFGTFKMIIAVSWLLGKLVMFFAVAYFLTSRFLKLVARAGFEERPRQMLIGYLLLVASLYAWAAIHFGSFAAVGIASMGGALLGVSNEEVKKKIVEGFESVLASIPIGILFIVLGIGVNFREAGVNLLFPAVLFITVIGTKLVGYGVATHGVFGSHHERILSIFGALPQGEMGMLVAAYLFSRGILDPSHFNTAIIVVVLLTMIVPVLIRIILVRFNVQAAPLGVAEIKNR